MLVHGLFLSVLSTSSHSPGHSRATLALTPLVLTGGPVCCKGEIQTRPCKSYTDPADEVQKIW